MQIIERIKLARSLLKDTMEQFGSRFKVGENSVHRWEHGLSEAPYRVIEFCEYVIEEMQFCPACNGTGILNKKQSPYIIAMGKMGVFTVLPQYNGRDDSSLRIIAGEAITHPYLNEKGEQKQEPLLETFPIPEHFNNYSQTDGYKVRQQRSSLRETQAQFAKRFHVSPVSVSQWETNKVKPPKEVLEWQATPISVSETEHSQESIANAQN